MTANLIDVSRIRQQIFLVGLMLAFTAAYSALAPVSLGRILRRRARDRSRHLLHRTKRRVMRARARLNRHLDSVRSQF